MRILTILTVAMLVSGCGSDKGSCMSLCEEIRPKLIEQLPDVSPEDIQCSEAPWTEAGDCDECLQILIDLFDAAPTDREALCQEHFG